jgi:hypothetical protein
MTGFKFGSNLTSYCRRLPPPRPACADRFGKKKISKTMYAATAMHIRRTGCSWNPAGPTRSLVGRGHENVQSLGLTYFAHRATWARGLGFGPGQWQVLPGSATVELNLMVCRFTNDNS